MRIFECLKVIGWVQVLGFIQRHSAGPSRNQVCESGQQYINDHNSVPGRNLLCIRNSELHLRDNTICRVQLAAGSPSCTQMPRSISHRALILMEPIDDIKMNRSFRRGWIEFPRSVYETYDITARRSAPGVRRRRHFAIQGNLVPHLMTL